MQKFLRNDVADLLKKGLDTNAYGRVEQLYVDQNVSTCYELIEQSCLVILNHLSAMDKQRECIDECKEAISTLMFAAARFADLPELRELRTLFSERYGSCLEPYVNKEFVKNMKGDTPTEEIKLLMMLEIKLEYDIEWDKNALEQKLAKPPPFVKDSSHYVNERNNQSHKPHHQNVQQTENKQTEVAKKDNTPENVLPYKSRTEIEKKNEKHTDQITGNSLPYKSRAQVEKKPEVKVKHNSPYWSSNSCGSSSESTTSQDDSASEDIAPERRKLPSLASIPPPYFKPESTKKSTSSETTSGLRSVGPPYIKKVATPEASSDITTKPVPRSVRIRRPLKPVAGAHGHNEVSKPIVKISNGENRDRDYDCKIEDEKERERKAVPGPTRITSLPTELLGGTGEIEEGRGFTRADSDLNSRSHVHPKLPDYDDFVARLAAFRAGS